MDPKWARQHPPSLPQNTNITKSIFVPFALFSHCKMWVKLIEFVETNPFMFPAAFLHIIGLFCKQLLPI